MEAEPARDHSVRRTSSAVVMEAARGYFERLLHPGAADMIDKPVFTGDAP